MAVYDFRGIETRGFKAQKESPTEDAYGGVLAAQRAVRHFLHELTERLDGCVHGSPSQPC